MLDFSCEIKGIPTIDLTKDEAVVRYLLPKANIADDPEDDLDVPTIAPGPSVATKLFTMSHSGV